MIGRTVVNEKNYDWEEINLELTEKAQNDSKYIAFKDWLIENGVKMDGVDYPVAFGPLGYIGAAASKDI